MPIYMQIEGITGERPDGGIDLVSFHFGVTNTVTKNLPGQVSELAVGKKTDSTSPALIQKCCSGEHINTLTITVFPEPADPASGAGVDYLKSVLSDVAVSSVREAASTPDMPAAMESISFNFAKFRVDFYKATGEVSSASCAPGR